MASKQALVKCTIQVQVQSDPGDLGQIQVAVPGVARASFSVQNLGPDNVQISNNFDKVLRAGDEISGLIGATVGLQAEAEEGAAICIVEATGVLS